MVRFSIVPRERKFFDLFEEATENLVQAGRVLWDMVEGWEDVEEKVQQIVDLEHQGDGITHRIMEQLHSTFVTPFDREDIAALAHSLDDVIDFIQAAADAMLLYKVSAATPRARELAMIIMEATEELKRAMPDLRTPSRLKDVLSHCVELNRLENAADRVLRAALGELFDEGTDVIHIIKWREIYDHMETATDRCEDVANVLEGVALKHA
ncbi:MAG: DUF47 family protein [Dehalococcoidia bacterium]